MILAAVVSIFILALAAPLLHRWLPHRSGWVLSILPLGLTVFFALKIPQINAGLVVIEHYDWVPRLGATLSIYLDGLSPHNIKSACLSIDTMAHNLFLLQYSCVINIKLCFINII